LASKLSGSLKLDLNVVKDELNRLVERNAVRFDEQSRRYSPVNLDLIVEDCFLPVVEHMLQGFGGRGREPGGC
jgi:acyl carrier protein phosphodiesterase